MSQSASKCSTNTQKSLRMTMTPDWGHIASDIKRKAIFQRVSDPEAPAAEPPIPAEHSLPIQHFLTGSSYDGTWNSIGFSGIGVYYFPHGAIYSGNFKNGQFHGTGVITYPVGHTLRCVHKNGKLIKQVFVFNDGLEVHYPNNYCQMPDRRFQVELKFALRGAGKEILTNNQPTVEIPEGCYDTIDGFYVPSVKCVYRYDEEALKMKGQVQHKQIADTLKRTIMIEEGKFIENYFRSASLGPVKYRPDLYECWMTGRKIEVDQVIPEMGWADRVQKPAESLESESSSDASDVKLEFEQLNTS